LLLDGEAQALTRKAIEAALAGDIMAMRRLCLERILPARRSRIDNRKFRTHFHGRAPASRRPQMASFCRPN
jgi:hypothetical protein